MFVKEKANLNGLRNIVCVCCGSERILNRSERYARVPCAAEWIKVSVETKQPD